MSRRLNRYQKITTENTDTERGEVDITISTDAPVDGAILRHAADSVDLSRANPLPLLWSHDARELPIGIVRDVRVDGGRLTGRAVFDLEDTRAAEIFGKVQRGVISGISVGADVDSSAVERGEDSITFKRWTPVEASLVNIPADAGAGVNRELIKELFAMSEENKAPAEPETRTERAIQNHTTAIDLGVKREAERQRAIRAEYAPFVGNAAISAVMTDCLDDPTCTVEHAQRSLIEAFAQLGEKPLAPAQPKAQRGFEEADVQPGADRSEKFAEGVTEAWLARGRALFTEDGRVDEKRIREVADTNEYTGYTMMEIVREFARMNGIQHGGSGDQLLNRAMTYRAGGHTDADLPAILSNVIGKALMVPLTPAEENWRSFSRVTSLRDFKTHTRPNLGTASDLKEIASGAGIERGFISDFEETLKARTFGVEIVVEYQTFRNDDLNVLTGLPVEMRRKAARKVGDLVWDIFISNPTLNATGNALFSAAHGNIYTTTGAGAPSVAILEAMMAAMATQRAPSPTGDDTNDPGDYLSITPRYMLVPHALRGRAEVLMRSTYDPDANAGSQVANTVNGRLEVIPEARLDGFNSAGYFIAGDPNQHATLEVGFVDGRETPMLAQESDWQTRGIKYAVWTDFDVKAMDYRALAYNDGAA